KTPILIFIIMTQNLMILVPNFSIGAPLVTMLIIVPITLLWLGPLGYQLGTVIAAGLGFVNTHLGWFSVGLMGAVTPLLVMTGTNQALFPLVFASLAANGYDAFVMPGMLAANVAVGASALAVSLTTKKTDDRALALSAGLTGVMGITEPSIFGVLIKNRRALISAIISGGIGGMIAGLVDLRQYAIVSPGIAAIPTFIPTNGKGLTSNFWMSILVLMISISLGFVITFILQKRFLKDYKEEQFTLPVNGKVIPLADVKDDVFSKGMVGDGIAIEPENGIICSPIAGTIIMIAPTKHAIGLRSNKGIEVLLHLGLDTVEMREAPFQIKVKKGDRVLANQELAIMDLDKVKNAGKDPIIIMILTSKDKHLSHIDYSKSKVGDRLGLLPS
ncbi:glucose PTS transporter subunit IIA, partial [Oenococcus oeni]|uniref:glucose PTS transporter subunit IIA n=1 Tax=Oenococcus oeni TaxID=1247 RepID=UPI001C91FC97